MSSYQFNFLSADGRTYLEFRIKVREIRRLKSKQFAQLSMKGQDGFERHGIAELIKEFGSHGRIRRDSPAS